MTPYNPHPNFLGQKEIDVSPERFASIRPCVILSAAEVLRSGMSGAKPREQSDRRDLLWIYNSFWRRVTIYILPAVTWVIGMPKEIPLRPFHGLALCVGCSANTKFDSVEVDAIANSRIKLSLHSAQDDT